MERFSAWLAGLEGSAWEPEAEEADGAPAEAARLRSELAGAEIEMEALKQEVDSLRLVLSEQNVLTSTALSSLKELKQDLEDQKAAGQGMNAAMMEAGMDNERLHSELLLEKHRSSELMKQLAKETALRSRLENALAGRDSSAPEAPEAQAPAAAKPQRYYLHYIPKSLFPRYGR
jgi:hypothetical protein